MKAVLLPNMVEFPAVSMKRYGEELTRALRHVGEPAWQFEELICHKASEIERFLPGKQGEAWASRVGRFVKYPRMAKKSFGDVYHVFDHSHANLVNALETQRTVLTCHDIIPLLAAKGVVPIPTGKLTRISFPLLRINAMKRCRFVITVSNATKRDLMEHGGLPDSQIVTVHNGVNALFSPLTEDAREERRRLIRKKHNLPEESRLILQVGTANRYKNTPTLLKAMQILCQKPTLKRSVFLLRIGADFFEDEAVMVREFGLENNVILVGRVAADTDLADYYRVADVLAFPSLYEGFGLPVAEAMACGTPSVSSNAASLPEVIGDAGITVSPTDAEAFAEGLHCVLTDEMLRADLQARCLARAPHFTWERCAREVLAVYEQVRAGKK